jgi:hypothetical protein
MGTFCSNWYKTILPTLTKSVTFSVNNVVILCAMYKQDPEKHI